MDSEHCARGKVLFHAEVGVDCRGKSSAYFGAPRPPFARQPPPRRLGGVGGGQSSRKHRLGAAPPRSAKTEVQAVARSDSHPASAHLAAIASEQRGAFAPQAEIA